MGFFKEILKLNPQFKSFLPTFTGTMGSFKAVTAKALVDAGAGAPLITCVPHADQEVAGRSGACGMRCQLPAQALCVPGAHTI